MIRVYRFTMRDREMAAAIVAGDPAGLAGVHDRYAAALHAYCRALLTDPGEAADAVRDTFIVATGTLAHLRDPDRLRPWLYAVARNECHRRLRAADAAGDGPIGPEGAVDGAEAADAADAAVPAAGETSDATRGPADIAAASHRSEPRELVDGALATLNPGERDIAELNLRHDLDDGDLAAMFGASRNQAHATASRARKQFDASLGALLVASAGPEFCPELDALLAGWDGELTAALRTLLNKHQKRCSVCGERTRRMLPQVTLFELLPVLALPDGVWPQVVGLVTDASPAGAANRAHIAERAGPLGKSGFPVPLDPPALTRVPKPSMLAPVVGVAALALLGAGTVIMTNIPHQAGSPHGARSAHGIQASGPSTAQQGPPVFPVATSPATPRARGRMAAPAVPDTASGSRAPLAGSASPASPAAGTLTVSATTVTLRRHGKGGRPTGSFTLTANGGPVAAFTITVPASVAGVLTVTPVTGSLAAGQSVQVELTVRKGYNAPLNTQVSVQPGGLAITVDYLRRSH